MRGFSLHHGLGKEVRSTDASVSNTRLQDPSVHLRVSCVVCRGTLCNTSTLAVPCALVGRQTSSRRPAQPTVSLFRSAGGLIGSRRSLRPPARSVPPLPSLSAPCHSGALSTPENPIYCVDMSVLRTRACFRNATLHSPHVTEGKEIVMSLCFSGMRAGV